MTTKRWAIRIIAGAAFFTAIICASAPAHALQAPMTEEEVTSFLKHESVCYVLAGLAGLDDQRERHLFRLKEFTDTHMLTISHSIGFANGWVEAVKFTTGRPIHVQAAGMHELQCLERA